MPKISKTVIRVHTEKINESFDVQISYSVKKAIFYIPIPDRLKVACVHLTDKDKEKFSVADIGKSYHSYSTIVDNRDIVVTGGTESDVCVNARKLFTKLSESEIKEREVIVVFHDLGTPGRNHKFSDGYDSIGMELGLTFCVETIVAGGEPVYYEYTKYNAFGEEKTVKRQIHLWNTQALVIDNTEENKEFLIKLYKSFDKLVAEMKKFTKSEKTLLSLIASQ